MPAIPRTDFYLQFENRHPYLIWIDPSDLGDHSNPYPIFPKVFDANFGGWESHWFPRLTEIRKYAAEQLNLLSDSIRFITDDRDLFESYNIYAKAHGDHGNFISIAPEGYVHPDKVHYPYKMIHDNFSDSRYITEQRNLRMQSTYPSHATHPHLSLSQISHLTPKHQQERQIQESDHKNQREHFEEQLTQYHQVGSDQHYYYMQQLNAHQREDRERLLHRQQMEIRKFHTQYGTR